MRTSFAGPAYGAKSELISGSLTSSATSQTNLNMDVVTVPSNEDWYVTQVQARAGTAGSDAGTVDVLDDGTTILSAVLTLSTTGTSRNVTASSGEDEGVKVASGSVVRVTLNTGTTTGAGNVTWHVYGYIRNIR